jgi:hypothetical protein
MEKMPELAQLITGFLVSPEAVQHFDAWCRTFGIIIRLFPSKEQGLLYNHLKELTLRELKSGHVTTAPGIKVIQMSQIPRLGLRTLDVADQPEPGFVERPVIAVRGWRELSALLRLAPAEPATLELLNSALEVHSMALVPALIDVLNRFDSQSIVRWVGRLLAGTQRQQVMAIDILVGTMDQHSEVRRKLIDVLAGYMKIENTPELVKTKARRTLEIIRGRPLWFNHRAVIDGLLPPAAGLSNMGTRPRAWSLTSSQSTMPPRLLRTLMSKGTIFLMQNSTRNRRMAGIVASQLPATVERSSGK